MNIFKRGRALSIAIKKSKGKEIPQEVIEVSISGKMTKTRKTSILRGTGARVEGGGRLRKWCRGEGVEEVVEGGGRGGEGRWSSGGSSWEGVVEGGGWEGVVEWRWS